MAIQLSSWVLNYMPDIAFAIIVIIGAGLIEFFIGRIYKTYRKQHGTKQGAQMTETALRVFVFIVAVVLLLASIPGLSSNAIRLVFGAIGIILALSSTTIIANAVSGVVIKIMGQYSVGDMVKIGGNLGKVSEIGTLQTELQMPKRGLVKLPNSLVLKEAIFNYTAQKYIVHVPVTLGYDIDRRTVEKLLVKAVKDTGLKNPFVFVLELGSNWVKYEANGLLEDTSKLVIIESNLRKNILDKFNSAGVEILSPDYLRLKKIPPKKKVLPAKMRGKMPEKREVDRESKEAEDVMFKKAKEEEEHAKRNEMDRIKLLESMKAKMGERNRIADWTKSKGIRVSTWTKPEKIIEMLATSPKITVADLKEFLEKSDDDIEKEKQEANKNKKSKVFLKV